MSLNWQKGYYLVLINVWLVLLNYFVFVGELIYFVLKCGS